MTRTDKKKAAQDLIMSHLAIIGYGRPFEEFVDEIGGDLEEANEILMAQMNRVAKLMGYDKAWLG